jgi:hypothetical protein
LHSCREFSSLKSKKKEDTDTSTVEGVSAGQRENKEEYSDLPPWVRALRQWKPRQEKNAVKPPNATSTFLPSIFPNVLNIQRLLPSFTPTSSRNFMDLLDRSSPSRDNLPSGSNSLEEVDAILESLQNAAVIVNVSSVLNSTKTPQPTDWLDDGWNRWDKWMYNMQSSLLQTSAASNLTTAADGILKKATLQLENLLSDVQPLTLQSVVELANATALAAVAVEGVNVTEAVEQAQKLGSFAGQLKSVADGLIQQGYVSSSNDTTTSTDFLLDPEKSTNEDVDEISQTSRQSGALFEDFASASEIYQYSPILGQAAEMAALSGVIYEEPVRGSLQLGHSIVASGCSMDVKWMVTDSLASHSELELHKDRIDNDRSESPLLIRTITIRGFDASDEEVDRETLVTEICRANAIPLGKNKQVKVHAGLWRIAKAIYKDVKQFIDWTTPQHKLILNGHSMYVELSQHVLFLFFIRYSFLTHSHDSCSGGSLSNLVLFLLTLDKGADYVDQRVLRVYTFGSPPVATLSDKIMKAGSSKSNKRQKSPSSPLLYCEVLESLGLPTGLVWAFVQPWDPICRLFSEIDPLYPLVDGMMDPESDGVTPWPGGPPRTLRPITKAILEAWDGWPRFRDTYFEAGSQQYNAIGIQHILLPEATRYLTDRFLTVSIAVPPVRSILRLSPNDIYPSLVKAFPLDVFEISYVPQAIRSFVHHFYPAYGFPFVEYVRLLEDRAQPSLIRDNLAEVLSSDAIKLEVGKGEDVSDDDSAPWAVAGDWLQATIPNRQKNVTTSR